MPYLSEKIMIKNTQFDKRIKLTEEDKIEIVKIREEDGISYAKIAAMFNVSKRSIYFVVNPDKLTENKQKRLERGGWKSYYHKETNTAYKKAHNRYK